MTLPQTLEVEVEEEETRISMIMRKQKLDLKQLKLNQETKFSSFLIISR